MKKVNKNSSALRKNSPALLCIFSSQTAPSLGHYTRNAPITKIGIDSNYLSLLISVDVCFGSPVGELLGSHNTEEEVAQYRNHARVPWPLYP